MQTKEVLAREEIEGAGFIYEPDRAKCKTYKLRWYVPTEEMINDEYKAELISQIPFAYVHEVKETENQYGGDTNFVADPKILVIGHTRKESILEDLVKNL